MRRSMRERRRRLLQGTLQGLVLLAGGLVRRLHATPLQAGRPWNAEAFRAKGVDAVLAALGLGGGPVEDARVHLLVPEIAESGAVVPVQVHSEVPQTRRILILALDNPNSLAADFRITVRLQPRIGTRIKLAETTTVLALVESVAGLHLARQTVKVTTGGCGG